MSLRAIEVRLVKGLNNPMVKDARLACFFSLALTTGLLKTPWAYNLVLLSCGLVFANRTQVRQERFALLLFASVVLDLIVMVPWAVHLTPDGWSAYRFVQYICWLELIILKWSAGQGLIWRLRDEGHVFASVLLEWESRKLYGNYFGDDQLPFIAPTAVPVLKVTPPDECECREEKPGSGSAV